MHNMDIITHAYQHTHYNTNRILTYKSHTWHYLGNNNIHMLGPVTYNSSVLFACTFSYIYNIIIYLCTMSLVMVLVNHYFLAIYSACTL